MRGFTLVETILYTAIVALVAGALVQFSLVIIQSRNKGYVNEEVNQNFRRATEEISRIIRGSTGIVTSTSVFNTDPGQLVLTQSTIANNPTIITLSGDDGTLLVKYGNAASTTLIADEVKVSNLVFRNLGENNGRQSVGFDITLQTTNSDSIDFYAIRSGSSAITLRQ